MVMKLLYTDKQICESLMEELESISDEEWEMLSVIPEKSEET